MTFTVGLTGGIASGKTTVANLFAERGVPVLDADQVARDVVAPGTPALAELVAALGDDILDADGRLDRPRMRQRVFDDADARRRMEAIIHPAVGRAMATWRAAQTAPYCMIVVPLLVEAGMHTGVDRVLVVDVPASVQQQRLIARDGISTELADQMIAAQASRNDRLAVAHDVLTNDDAPAALAARVAELDGRYRDHAAAADN